MQMKRLQFSSWLVAGLCVCASAQAAEALPPSLRTCMSESDPTQRLACFDRESARLTQESAPVARRADPPTSAPPAAAPAAASAAPAAAAASSVAAPTPSAEDKFGYRGSIARADLDKKSAEERQEYEQLTAKVSELGTMPHGELLLTLDNGQVWQQKAGDRAMRIKVGEAVTIRRASLGSFLLTSQTSNGSMRVTRVK
jgi:hypothetical protein